MCIKRIAEQISSTDAQITRPRHARQVSVEQGDQVWACSIGGGAESERTPLLILHGGPGLPHDDLENLEALPPQQRVIFYGQLGCGRSDQPDDLQRWLLPRFVAEIETLRSALGLERLLTSGARRSAGAVSRAGAGLSGSAR